MDLSGTVEYLRRQQRLTSLFVTFRVSRKRREMYCGYARLCVSVSVCLSVCLSAGSLSTALKTIKTIKNRSAVNERNKSVLNLGANVRNLEQFLGDRL